MNVASILCKYQEVIGVLWQRNGAVRSAFQKENCQKSGRCAGGGEVGVHIVIYGRGKEVELRGRERRAKQSDGACPKNAVFY